MNIGHFYVLIGRPCCTGVLGDCILTSKDDCRRRLLTSSCARIHGVYLAPKRIKSAGYGPNHGFIVKPNFCCSDINVLFYKRIFSYSKKTTKE